MQKGEHWDSTTSTMVKSYKMAKAKVKGEKPDVGEHQKFGT